MHTLKKAALVVAYLSTIVAANFAIRRFGLVPVGFGLLAPAGVYFAGLAFGLRDVLQDAAGKAAVIGAIAAGTALSALISPALAVASGTAFLVSELADFLVYTPLRDRSWYGAVAVSNVVGSVVDSWIFLSIAFGSLAFMPGQVVGKALMVLPIVVGRVALSSARRIAI